MPYAIPSQGLQRNTSRRVVNTCAPEGDLGLGIGMEAMVLIAHPLQPDSSAPRAASSFQASHSASLLPERLQLCKVILWVWPPYPSALGTQPYCEASREKPPLHERSRGLERVTEAGVSHEHLCEYSPAEPRCVSWSTTRSC